MVKDLKVISLGGSTLFNDNYSFNISFIKKFKSLALSYCKKNNSKLIIVLGGGKTARVYIHGLKKFNLKIPKSDYDEIGIETIKINALFISKIFGKGNVYSVTNDLNDIERFMKSSKSILLVYGAIAGGSSDYTTTQFAIKAKVKSIINITNIDYVYDKNPSKYKNAKPIKQLSWNEFMKIIGSKIESGGNYPFDPVASKLAMKNKKQVYSVKYSYLSEIKKILENQKCSRCTLIGED